MLAGKNLIKEEEELHQLFLYDIKPNFEFNFIKKINLDEQYRSFSKAIHFFEEDAENKILMINSCKIVKFNYRDETHELLYQFKNELSE